MQTADWLEMPDLIYRTHYVRMSKEERALYDEFEREHIIPLLDGSITADAENADNAIVGDTAATAKNKLLQMACGSVYDDEGGVFHIHDRKLDALEDIVEAANGQPLLVFYTFKFSAEQIQTRFPHAVQLGDPNASTDARVHGKGTSEIIELWNKGELPMLLCHPASAGHGLNLQDGGHIAVWYAPLWSLELYQQANKRLHRRGQTQSVILMHIICEGTWEEQVMTSLENKDITQSSLLRALKQYVAQRK